MNSEPEIAVRKASTPDASSIAETFIASRAQAMPFLPKLYTNDEITSWIEKVILKEREVWVAVQNGKCIGFIALAPEDVDHLYVHPNFQNRGVGKHLLQFGKDRFKKLRLYVFQKNTGARRFYEREGFRLVSLGDGSGNEEREPDALYEWNVR